MGPTTPLALISLLLAPIALAQTPSLNLTEGSACKVGAQEGVCRPIDECKSEEQFDQGSPAICSQGNGTDVICCLPSRVPRAIPGSKANAYCEEKLKTCNRSFGGDVEFRQGIQSTIAGGRLAMPGEHPHMALIGYGDTKEWLCGGTLISERFVISAAHCARQADFGPASWVRVGDLDYSTDEDRSDPQEVKISRIVVHPEFREPAMYNDIALFQLEKDVRMNEFARPACLHTSSRIPYKVVTAAGWGRTGFVESLSPQLRVVEIRLVNESLCNSLRGVSARAPQGIRSSSMICAGEDDGMRDTCQGDSGGPVVVLLGNRCLFTQVGVTSFGGICAEPNSPGVYTRISHYVPWIESVVWP